MRCSISARTSSTSSTLRSAPSPASTGPTTTSPTCGASPCGTPAAHSTATISLRLPVDPSEIELTAFGGVGRHRLSGRAADAPACYARLLDGFVDAVRGGPPVALDVARGLRLQEIVDEVGRAAG